MSSYGELITALKSFRNVKDKRQAIKSLAAICNNTAYHNRIINNGGWIDAIQPLLTSLDQECRTQATYALANLSASVETHAHLIQHDAITELARLASEDDMNDLCIYAITALGNLAATPVSWPEFLRLGILNTLVRTLHEQTNEFLIHACLFAIGNLTADLEHLDRMTKLRVLDYAWKYMYEPNDKIYMQTLTVIRGLATHRTCQEALPKLGILPFVASCVRDAAQKAEAKEILLDILANVTSASAHNSGLVLSHADCVAVLHEVLLDRKKYPEHSTILPAALAVVANICENVSLHDTFAENKLMESLLLLTSSQVTSVQVHLVRAIANLCVSLKLHERIMNGSRALVRNLASIAVNDNLDSDMCIQAALSLSALSATKPTCIAIPEQTRLVHAAFVADNGRLQLLLVTCIANCATHPTALEVTLPLIKRIVALLYHIDDTRCYQEIMRLLMNMSVVDTAVAADLVSVHRLVDHVAADVAIHKLSLDGLLYFCRLLTRAAEYDACRAIIVKTSTDGRSPFNRIMETCKTFIASEGVTLAPHCALLTVTLTAYTDVKEALVRHGVVDFLVELYTSSDSTESVRLRSIVGLANLVEYEDGCRAIVGGDGIHAFLKALEVESHVDIILPALRAVLTLSTNEQHAALITGTDVGGVITIASFLYSDDPDVVRAALGILSRLLKVSQDNRLDFLGFTGCPDDFLVKLLEFLPDTRKRGIPPTIVSRDRPAEGKVDLHVIACVASCLASLARERDVACQELLLSVEAHVYMYQVCGLGNLAIIEDARIFFAELLHAPSSLQKRILSNDQTAIIKLVMAFEAASVDGKVLSLSAILALSRSTELQPLLIPHIEALVLQLNNQCAGDIRVALLLAQIFETLAETGPKNLIAKVASLHCFDGLIELGKTGLTFSPYQVQSTTAAVNAVAELIGRGAEFGLPFVEELLQVRDSMRFIVSIFLSHQSILEGDYQEKLWSAGLLIIHRVLSCKSEAEYVLRQLDLASDLCKVGHEAVSAKFPHVRHLGYRLIQMLSLHDHSKQACLKLPRLLEQIASFARAYSIHFNVQFLAQLETELAARSVGMIDYECYLISLFILSNLSDDLQSMFMTVGSRAPWNRRLLSTDTQELSHVEEASIFVRYLPGKLMKRIDFDVLARGIKSNQSGAPLLMLEFSRIALPCVQRYLSFQELQASIPDCLAADFSNLDDLRLFLSGLITFIINCFKTGEGSHEVCCSGVSLAMMILYLCPDLCNKRVNTQVLEILRLSSKSQLTAVTALLAHASVKSVDAQVFMIPSNVQALQEAFLSDRQSRLNILNIVASVTKQSDGEICDKLGVTSWMDALTSKDVLQVDDYRELIEICKILGNLSERASPTELSVRSSCAALMSLSVLILNESSDQLKSVGKDHVIEGMVLAAAAVHDLPTTLRDLVAAYPGFVETLSQVAATVVEPRYALKQIAFKVLAEISSSKLPPAKVIGEYLVNCCLLAGVREDPSLILRRLSIIAAYQSHATITEPIVAGVIQLARAIQLHDMADVQSQRRLVEIIIRSPVTKFGELDCVFACLAGLLEFTGSLENIISACLSLVDCKEEYWARSNLLGRLLDKYPLSEPFPVVDRLLRLIYGLLSCGYTSQIGLINRHDAVLPALRYSLSLDGEVKKFAAGLLPLWLNKQVDDTLWESLTDYGIVRLVMKKLISEVDMTTQDYLVLSLVTAIDKGYLNPALIAVDSALVQSLFSSFTGGHVTGSLYRLLLNCGDCSGWLQQLIELFSTLEGVKQHWILNLALKTTRQRIGITVSSNALIKMVDSCMQSHESELKTKASLLLSTVTVADSPGRLIERLVEVHFVKKDASFSAALTTLSSGACKIIGDCFIKFSLNPQLLLPCGNWGLVLFMGALSTSTQFKSLVGLSLPLPFDLSTEERAIAALYCICHCPQSTTGVCNLLERILAVKYYASAPFRSALARLLRMCGSNDEVTRSIEYINTLRKLITSVSEAEGTMTVVDSLVAVSNSTAAELYVVAVERLLMSEFTGQRDLIISTATLLCNAVSQNITLKTWPGLSTFVTEALGSEVALSGARFLNSWTFQERKPLDNQIVKAISSAIARKGVGSAELVPSLVGVLSNDLINDESRSNQYLLMVKSVVLDSVGACFEVCRFGRICKDLKLCILAFHEMNKVADKATAAELLADAASLVRDCLIDYCRVDKAVPWVDYDSKSIERALDYCMRQDRSLLTESMCRTLYGLCMTGFNFFANSFRSALLKTAISCKDWRILKVALPAFAVLHVKDAAFKIDEKDVMDLLLVIVSHKWGEDLDYVLSSLLKMLNDDDLARTACQEQRFLDFIADILQDPLREAPLLVYHIIHNVCMHVEDSSFFVDIVAEAVEPNRLATAERRMLLGTIYGHIKAHRQVSDRLKVFLTRFEPTPSEVLLHLTCMSLGQVDIEESYLLQLVLMNDAQSLCTPPSAPFSYVIAEKDNNVNISAGRSLYQRNIWGSGAASAQSTEKIAGAPAVLVAAALWSKAVVLLALHPNSQQLLTLDVTCKLIARFINQMDENAKLHTQQLSFPGIIQSYEILVNFVTLASTAILRGVPGILCFELVTRVIRNQVLNDATFRFVTRSGSHRYAGVVEQVVENLDEMLDWRWLDFVSRSLAEKAVHSVAFIKAVYTLSGYCLPSVAQTEALIPGIWRVFDDPAFVSDLSNVSQVLTCLRRFPTSAMLTDLEDFLARKTLIELTRDRVVPEDLLLLILQVSQRLVESGVKSNQAAGMSLLLSLAQTKVNCKLIAKTRQVQNLSLSEALPLLALLISNDPEAASILKPSILAVSENVDVSILTPVEMHMLCYCLLACDAPDRVKPQVRIRLESIYTSTEQLSLECDRCKVLAIDDMSLATAVADNLRSLFWSLLSGKGKSRELLSQQNSNLIFQLFGASEPRVLLSFVNALLSNTQTHEQLVESKLILYKLADMSLASHQTAILYVTTFCTFLGGPKDSVIAGARAAPGWMVRGIRELSNFITLAEKTSPYARLLNLIWLPRAIPALSAPIARLDLPDLTDQYCELLLLVMRRSRTSKTRLLAIDQLVLRANVQYLQRSGFNKIAAKLVATGGEAFVEGVVRAVTSACDAAGAEEDKDMFRHDLISSGFIPTMASKARSVRCSSRTSLILWTCFGALLSKCDATVFDYLLRVNVLEHFLYISVDHGRGASVVANFLTHVLYIPMVESLRDSIYIAFQNNSVHGFLLVGGLTTLVDLSRLICNKVIKYIDAEILADAASSRKLLPPAHLDLFPALARDEDTTAVILSALLKWAVKLKIPSLLYQVCSATRLVDFLVAKCSSGLFKEAASAACILLNAAHAGEGSAFLILGEKRLVQVIAANEDFFRINAVRAFVMSTLRINDAAPYKWSPQISACMQIFTFMMTDMREMEALAILAESALASCLRLQENRNSLLSDTRCKELLLLQLDACLQYPHDEDAFESLLLPLMVLSDTADLAIDCDALLRIVQTTSRPLLRLYAGKVITRVFFTHVTDESQIFQVATWLRKALSDGDSGEVFEGTAFLIKCLLTCMTKAKFASIRLDDIGKILRTRRWICECILTQEMLCVMFSAVTRLQSTLLDSLVVSLVSLFVHHGELGRGYNQVLFFDNSPVELKSRLINQGISQDAMDDLPVICMDWLLEGSLFAAQITSCLCLSLQRSLSYTGLFSLCKLLVTELQCDRGIMLLQCVMRVFTPRAVWEIIKSENELLGRAGMILAYLLIDSRLPVNSDSISKAFTDAHVSYTFDLIHRLSEAQGENGPLYTLNSLAHKSSMPAWLLIGVCLNSTKEAVVSSDFVALCYEAACEVSNDSEKLVHIVYSMFAVPSSRSFIELSILSALTTPTGQSFRSLAASLASLKITVVAISKSNWASAISKNQNCRNVLITLIQFASAKYTPQTVLVKHHGSAWDRLLLDSGLTLAMANLLIDACKVDSNIAIIEQMGGARALREISAYCEDFETRKMATAAMHKMLGLPELRNLRN